MKNKKNIDALVSLAKERSSSYRVLFRVITLDSSIDMICDLTKLLHARKTNLISVESFSYVHSLLGEYYAPKKTTKK